MKIFKSIICIVLVLAFACAFIGCEKKPNRKDDILLATIGGTEEIWANDIVNWQNYMIGQAYDSYADLESEEEIVLKIAEIMDNATLYVAQMKCLEKELVKKGYMQPVTDEDVEQKKAELIAFFDELYKDDGGYQAFLKSMDLTEDFMKDYARVQLSLMKLESYVKFEYPITDDMIIEYWEAYMYKYLVTPSYVINTIAVTVADSDLGNKEAWDEAKAEAESILARLKNGENFGTVQEEYLKNSKNPDKAALFSSRSEISKDSCREFEDLEYCLKESEAIVKAACEQNKINFVEYASPTGDENEYSVWFMHLNTRNEAFIKNGLLNAKEGDLLDVIPYVYGYEIVLYESTTDDLYFDDPRENPEVYNEIYEELWDIIWAEGSGTGVEATLSQLEKDYGIEIKYSYYDVTKAKTNQTSA